MNAAEKEREFMNLELEGDLKDGNREVSSRDVAEHGAERQSELAVASKEEQLTSSCSATRTRWPGRTSSTSPSQRRPR